MERLTYFVAEINGKRRYSSVNFQRTRGGNKQDFIDRIGLYEDTGLEPSEIPTGLELANVYAAMQELKRYEDAEEQGLLVWLPCKVGSTVYVIDDGNIYRSITQNTVVRPGIMARVVGVDRDIQIVVYKEQIGKTVFLTRKAAEAALAEMNDTGER